MKKTQQTPALALTCAYTEGFKKKLIAFFLEKTKQEESLQRQKHVSSFTHTEYSL